MKKMVISVLVVIGIMLLVISFIIGYTSKPRMKPPVVENKAVEVKKELSSQGRKIIELLSEDGWLIYDSPAFCAIVRNRVRVFNDGTVYVSDNSSIYRTYITSLTDFDKQKIKEVYTEKRRKLEEDLLK
jgi:hypothetical protein